MTCSGPPGERYPAFMGGPYLLSKLGHSSEMPPPTREPRRLRGARPGGGESEGTGGGRVLRKMRPVRNERKKVETKR